MSFLTPARFVRLILRLILFVFWTCLLVPLQLILLCFTRGQASYLIPQLWHKGILKIANTKVILSGNLQEHSKNFYIGNHFSSMDIPILGAYIKASFVAKADVERYPIFGFLASVQQTVFISRNPRHADIALQKMGQMLEQDKDLIIFPEGTSTDGSHIIPFKSSLFEVPLAFAEKNIVLKAFTLELISVEGKTDLDRDTRNLFTLSPDVEFWQNFFSIMSLSSAVVRLHFHPPVSEFAQLSRKDLSQKMYEIVSSPLPPLA